MSVSVTFTPESRRLLNTWAAKNKDKYDQAVTRWITHLDAWLSRESLRSFDTQGQQGGKNWQPNRGRYAEWKAGFGQTKAGILTGDLRQSISTQRTRDEVRVGSGIDYADEFFFGRRGGGKAVMVHGPGGNVGVFNFSGGSPPRPFLPAEDYTERHMASSFADIVWRAL